MHFFNKTLLRSFILLVFTTTVVLYNQGSILNFLDSVIAPHNEKCQAFPDAIKKRINTNLANRTYEYIESNLRYLNIKSGKNLSNKDNPLKLAIIIPYRDRDRNLKIFLEYMHKFLSDQRSNYGIYLAEPIKGLKFNRALLMNIGFMEAKKDYNWNCYIFHDIDMLPENNNNIYNCDKDYPKQLAISISVYNYVVSGYLKNRYFGGINAFTPEQFHKVNGFSNSYFNWGMEDDDMYLRVSKNYQIKRLDPTVGRYFANCHVKQEKNPQRLYLYVKAKTNLISDGLSTLQYDLLRAEKKVLFTRFFVSYKAP